MKEKETVQVTLWWSQDRKQHGGIPAEAEAPDSNGNVKVHYRINNEPRVKYVTAADVEWRLSYLKKDLGDHMSFKYGTLDLGKKKK